MASIHGLSLKNIKTWMGREGQAYQGDVYLGNEKICFWSQDGNGGIDTFYFEKMYSERNFINVFKELYKDKPYIYTFNGEECHMEYSVDLLMADIMELQETEEKFIKYKSRGYKGIFVIESDYYQTMISLDSSDISKTDEQLKNLFRVRINQFIKEHGKENLNITIYRDIKDFNKEEPIREDQIYDVRKIKEFYEWDTLIFEDKTITKEDFDKLSFEEQQKILKLDFIPSKKDNCFYEKDYLLSLTKDQSKERDLDLDER